MADDTQKAKDQRFFWLRLKRDFFKRHDIRIIETMPNGKDYILFYLKLLCESVDHEGRLRFSEEIPYNAEMLATITNTNIDIVRSAIEVFTKLHMMELLDDGTFFMQEVQKMIGSETYWAEKKREQRQREAAQALLTDNVIGQCPTESNECQTCPSKSKSNSKNKSNKKSNTNIPPYNPPTGETEGKEKQKRFIPPSVEEVEDYCRERKNTIDAEEFVDFYASKGWKVGNQSMKDWKAAVRTWEKTAKKRRPNRYEETDWDNMTFDEELMI